MIVSGGYGIVLASEPIGHYDRAFKPSDWPRGLLQQVLVEVGVNSARSDVVGLFAATTGYARFFRSVEWPSGIRSRLVAPSTAGGGAMRTVPQTIGQALTRLADGQIEAGWQSNSRLSLRIEELT